MAEVMITREHAPAGHADSTGPLRGLGVGLLVLAAALVANTLLGPLFLGAINYPFSETVHNETLGLETVSLVLVAPLCAATAVLALRGQPRAAVLALGPTSYSAYMFVQYVAGPQYLAYAPSLALHVAIFALASGLLVGAWSLAATKTIPVRSRSADRRWGRCSSVSACSSSAAGWRRSRG